MCVSALKLNLSIENRTSVIHRINRKINRGVQKFDKTFSNCESNLYARNYCVKVIL